VGLTSCPYAGQVGVEFVYMQGEWPLQEFVFPAAVKAKRFEVGNYNHSATADPPILIER